MIFFKFENLGEYLKKTQKLILKNVGNLLYLGKFSKIFYWNSLS